MRPTGPLHLGHLVGALQNWVALQGQHECIYCIVDYHAITGAYEPADLRRWTREMAVSLLHNGADPLTEFPKELVL